MLKSAINKFPELSIATQEGLFNFARVGAYPSPSKPCAPSPATVFIVPLVVTSLILLFPSSEIKRLPLASTVTLTGLFNWEVNALFPSPLKPLVPFPATVYRLPVDASTLRIL